MIIPEAVINGKSDGMITFTHTLIDDITPSATALLKYSRAAEYAITAAAIAIPDNFFIFTSPFAVFGKRSVKKYMCVFTLI